MQWPALQCGGRRAHAGGARVGAMLLCTNRSADVALVYTSPFRVPRACPARARELCEGCKVESILGSLRLACSGTSKLGQNAYYVYIHTLTGCRVPHLKVDRLL